MPTSSRRSSRRSSRDGSSSSSGLSKDETAFGVIRMYVLQADFYSITDPDNVMKKIWIRKGTEKKDGVEGVDCVKEDGFTVKKYIDLWRKEMLGYEDIIVQWGFKLPAEAKAHLDKNLFDDDDDGDGDDVDNDIKAAHVVKVEHTLSPHGKEKAKSAATNNSEKKNRRQEKQTKKEESDGDDTVSEGVRASANKKVSRKKSPGRPAKKAKASPGSVKGKRKSVSVMKETKKEESDDENDTIAEVAGARENKLPQKKAKASPDSGKGKRKSVSGKKKTQKEESGDEDDDDDDDNNDDVGQESPATISEVAGASANKKASRKKSPGRPAKKAKASPGSGIPLVKAIANKKPSQKKSPGRPAKNAIASPGSGIPLVKAGANKKSSQKKSPGRPAKNAISSPGSDIPLVKAGASKKSSQKKSPGRPAKNAIASPGSGIPLVKAGANKKSSQKKSPGRKGKRKSASGKNKTQEANSDGGDDDNDDDVDVNGQEHPVTLSEKVGESANANYDDDNDGQDLTFAISEVACSTTNITLTKKKCPSRPAKKAKISPSSGEGTQNQRQETISVCSSDDENDTIELLAGARATATMSHQKKSPGRPLEKAKHPNGEIVPPRNDGDFVAHENIEGDDERNVFPKQPTDQAPLDQDDNDPIAEVCTGSDDERNSLAKQPTEVVASREQDEDDPDAKENIGGDDEKNRLAEQPPGEAASLDQDDGDNEGNIRGDNEESHPASSVSTERCQPPKEKQYTLSSQMAEQQTAKDPDPSTPTFVSAHYRLKSPINAEGKIKKAFACPKCGKVFSSTNGMRYHVERNVCENAAVTKKAKTIDCRYCAMTFTSAKDLQIHLDNKVCDKAYNCPQCGNPFSTLGRLRRHLDKRFCKVLASKAGSPMGKANTKAGDSSSTPEGKKKLEEGRRNPVRASRLSSKDGKCGRKVSKKRGVKRNRESDKSVASPSSSSSEAYAHEKMHQQKLVFKRNREKFHQLKPGSKFITRYGVVGVIADDRLPSDYYINTVVWDKNADRLFNRRHERFRERQNLVVDQIAAGTRHRREELKNMYLQSMWTDTNTASMTQKNVWNLYCQSVTPDEILTRGSTCTSNNDELERRNKIEKFDLNENPHYPREYFPDRAVECKLVVDRREVLVVTVSEGFVPHHDLMENQVEFHPRFENTTQNQTVPMRLFITRKELDQEYYSRSTEYICGYCDKQCSHRNQILLHLRTGCCAVYKARQEEKKQQRMKAIEEKALSGSGHNLLQDFHGVKKPPSHMDPAPFGNPHKIKSHKKHKMPPWLVYNPQRSAMYPETYISMEFKRGSQNRNHFKKLREEEGYMSKAEKSRRRKKKKRVRIEDPGGNSKPTLPSHSVAAEKELPKKARKTVSLKMTEKPKHHSNLSSLAAKKKSSARKTWSVENIPSLPPALPPALPPLPPLSPAFLPASSPASSTASSTASLPASPPASPPFPSISDHDTIAIGYGHKEGGDDPTTDAAPDPLHPNGATSNLKVVKHSNSNNKGNLGASSSSDDKGRRKKRVFVSKKKNSIVIDTQVLATECVSGRYPTINRFYGYHEKLCTLCKNSGDTPPFNCDFCKNSVHQICMDKRMLLKDPQVIIRESEPHDMLMCHECIAVCMFRRSRAENRRMVKWQHELSKTGLEIAPEAASLKEEVNIQDGANGETRAVEEPTFKPCPNDGPGGLICCSYCTAAYSRFLSNTAKEMEIQSIAGVGQEVSEMLELLEDAKQRLRRSSEVSQSNEERRSLLEKSQVGSDSLIR